MGNPVIIIIIIIIITKNEEVVQGWERVRTQYQSENPNPSQPTRGRKEKTNGRRKNKE